MTSTKTLKPSRARQILDSAHRSRIVVVGDVMLDRFIWGKVSRISPEAPVPIVEVKRQSFMPGGAANVARNLTSLEVPTEIFGAVGNDEAAGQLKKLLREQKIACTGIVTDPKRDTSVKTRVVAHEQQVVRLDWESRDPLNEKLTGRILNSLASSLKKSDALIIGDYGKGVVTQQLLDGVKALCQERGVWLSLDPKPSHPRNLSGLSLITPNRGEAFELASVRDETQDENPLADKNLMLVADRLLGTLSPKVLLITLGELGMLLCQPGKTPFHIPTVAQSVFDVSGAGDTVIATFTLAIAGGASLNEAAILSNQAAGIVVGKVGTAVTTPEELLKSLG